MTNVAGLARDAGVSRPTVQNYFGILEDTLLGFWLRPWKLKTATRQVGHPKFYLFDGGVARALSGRLPYPSSPEEKGPLMETWILNEFRPCLAYRPLRAFGVYLGIRPASWDGIEVLPAREFLDRLWAGKIV